MKKIYPILITIILTIGITLGVQALLPHFTHSTIILNGPDLINKDLKVTYRRGCSFSPCYSEVIFEGKISKEKKIRIPTWHAKNLNLCGIPDWVHDCYMFDIEGFENWGDGRKGNGYIHIERKGRAFMIIFDSNFNFNFLAQEY